MPLRKGIYHGDPPLQQSDASNMRNIDAKPGYDGFDRRLADMIGLSLHVRSVAVRCWISIL